MMKRRQILLAITGAAVTAGAAGALWRSGTRPSAAAVKESGFEITKTEAEWRAQLTPNQYAVLREEATERAFTSPLLHEKRKGVFKCAGCDLPLYSSETKYKSGTGWPSFWQPLAQEAVETETDQSLGMVRTEVHCRRCGSHLGHLFPDGPDPTGMRYCINSVSLKLDPDGD